MSENERAYAAEQKAAGQIDGLTLKLLELKDFFSVAPPLETPFLKQLFVGEVITIAPTDGCRTITQAKDVFYGIDFNFTNWDLTQRSSPMQAMPVIVVEQKKDGTFMEILGSAGNLEELCFTQHQIIAFAQEHRQKLRQCGHGVFFSFKKDETRSIYAPDNGFVASVYMYSRGLDVFVNSLSRDVMWRAEYCLRFVVPQLPV